jgi:RNA polymerase sigma-70 factor, ECF subfamily
MSSSESEPSGDLEPRSEALWRRVYPILRRMAAQAMRGERKDHTLDATALVNEAYVRLASAREKMPRDEAGFLAMASRKMRHVLVDHARRRKGRKRGGDWARITLDEGVLLTPGRHIDLMALDEAMEKLAAEFPRVAQIVELRFFMGLTEPEVAEVLGVSVKVVERQWKLGKAWLSRELGRGGPPGSSPPPPA